MKDTVFLGVVSFVFDVFYKLIIIVITIQILHKYELFPDSRSFLCPPAGGQGEPIWEERGGKTIQRRECSAPLRLPRTSEQLRSCSPEQTRLERPAPGLDGLNKRRRRRKEQRRRMREERRKPTRPEVTLSRHGSALYPLKHALPKLCCCVLDPPTRRALVAPCLEGKWAFFTASFFFFSLFFSCDWRQFVVERAAMIQ